MLGGSLDCIVNMCSCALGTRCKILDCECNDYCRLYRKILPDIIGGQYVYLTYSPKIDRARSELVPDYEMELCQSFFTLLVQSQSTGDFIFVPELTLKGQLHFHALIRVTDKTKFTKTITQKLYWEGNILPLWNQMPKEGFHYLFKTAHFMKDYFELYDVDSVYTNRVDIDSSED